MPLATINVPATDIQKEEAFYAYLIGGGFKANPMDSSATQSYKPLSAAATLNNTELIFTITQRSSPQESTICYFKVDDLQSAIAELQNRGGTIITQPFSLPTKGKASVAAIIGDPDGNAVGIFSI